MNQGFGNGRELRPTTKVLPEHARGHNRSLVMQTLYREGQLSRADIARETGLTRITISDLVADLIGENLVALVEFLIDKATRPILRILAPDTSTAAAGAAWLGATPWQR